MTDRVCSVDGCEGPATRREWCNKHYLRWRRNGDPLIARKRANGELLEALRAAARADHDSCIEVGHSGRPNAKLNGEVMHAARVVWALAHGHPGDAHVLHTCHNDKCVSVNHLYLGDAKQNSADMVEADRESRPSARLSPADVAAIRQRHRPGTNRHDRGNTAELAAEFGVSQVAINEASRGATWRKVGPLIVLIVLTLVACGRERPMHRDLAADPTDGLADAVDYTDPTTTTVPATTTTHTHRPRVRVSRGARWGAPDTMGDAFWKALSNCESPTGKVGAHVGYFQFSWDTAAKVGIDGSESYEVQKDAAIEWARRIHPNEGTSSGWPNCWWVALKVVGR